LISPSSIAGSGESLYWKYESFLKKLDSELYTTVGAAGELFSIRRSLYERLPEDTIIEDFVQSLRLCSKGYIVKYEPEAYALELPSGSVKDEMKRKIRISAGAFQAMGRLKTLFNPFRYPVVFFQFVSHRILRWTLCPIALLLLLLSNPVLVAMGSHIIYYIVLLFQLIFYALALAGWRHANRNSSRKIFNVPFYFLFMNMAVFIGFNRFMNKRQTAIWEKASRINM
jgi:cellulose synthase/poly-beta-1,6-N-acetylglucosamine synthase-like glycosyltransferase